LLPTAKVAKEDNKNCLSVEDDGKIYIETPKYGEFTVNNPANAHVSSRNFSCFVRKSDGEVKSIYLPFESEEAAKRFMYDKFDCGAYIPRMNLDLHKAIVASDNYKQRLISELDALSE